ncbi:MAG: aldehyde dehydrogenase [Syntrophales bacterium]|jgi:aldehyde dehydrogenase (NAD+)|nr:aldehyde dehydrogenase [Syntrophales bacterium]MCK9528174.1 aldehyde dehydrogenase [Syntrophales bacterium]
MNLEKRVKIQREYFRSGITLDISFRTRQLKILEEAIRAREDRIMEALEKDLAKPRFESYSAEIGILYPEIREALRKTATWARPRRVGTPMLHFFATSVVYHQPYGLALIISPWNYPFQLAMAPLVGAIAAGNCAILKPSELAPETSKEIALLAGDAFDPSFITVVEGGVPETRALLDEKFDYIFFTGGTAVGRIIMESAARQLIPVTLELGGKSPAVVCRDAKMDCGARRIAWGKYYNAGQTCLAPDYVLVHRDVKEKLIDGLRRAIVSFYGNDPEESPDYGRIINQRHFSRLTDLMKSGRIVHGGRANQTTRYIAPTIIDGVSLTDPIMEEEIFGPLLPLLPYGDLDEALDIVNALPRPLALYVFTESRTVEKRVLAETSSGGGCVNDTLSHVGSTTLPFGGIGDSGMGSYHGKAGFDTFTHRRSVLKRSTLFDIPLRYPPYAERKLRLVRRLFKPVG